MLKPRRLSPPAPRRTLAVSSKDLIFAFLGLEASDTRLPVSKVSDKIGGGGRRPPTPGQEIRSDHLSDLVVFYSEYEFSLYLRKVDNE
jgi:hypothetical protein